jgi:23S rRNA (guanine745-N1)-methyltransferase
MTLVERVLRCGRGHAFDVAREGYVALAPPGQRLAPGDSAQMVAAREQFLATGHYRKISQEIVDALPGDLQRRTGNAPLAVDLGAGTGHHLAALLEARAGWRGVALDASRPALRRSARAHRAIAAVACDAWLALPLRDASADLVLSVFAPRNAPEIARILAPTGALVAVTPTQRHLRELIDAVGLLDVGADKQQRLRTALAPRLESVQRRELEFEMTLGHDELRALIAMGPSAHHIGAQELERRVAGLEPRVAASASLVIETFRSSDAVERSD